MFDRAFNSTPDHSDRRIALQNDTGGREKNEEMIGEETPEQRGLQQAKRFPGHTLVRKGAEARVIVLIYTIQHPKITPALLSRPRMSRVAVTKTHRLQFCSVPACMWGQEGCAIRSHTMRALMQHIQIIINIYNVLEHAQSHKVSEESCYAVM